MFVQPICSYKPSVFTNFAVHIREDKNRFITLSNEMSPFNMSIQQERMIIL